MMEITKEQFINDLTSLIRPAIEKGMNLSTVADVICEFTKMSRENALQLVSLVGVQMNMELGYSYQEAVDGFFGK